MRKLQIIIPIALSILAGITFSCELGDKIEFTNFRQTLALDQQPNPKGPHYIIQTDDEGYLIAGLNLNNELIVTRITKGGEPLNSTPIGSGSPSGLVRLGGKPERYLLAGNDGSNCFIQEINPQGGPNNNRIILNPIVNDSVGLVQSLSIDAVFPSQDSSIFCVGVIKQTLSKNPRMFAFFVKSNGALARVGTFRENVNPLALAQRQSDNFFVWGNRNDHNYITAISNKMELLIENPANNLSPTLLGSINLKNANVAVNNRELWLPTMKAGVLDTIYLSVFNQDLQSVLSVKIPQAELLSSKNSTISSIRIAPVRNNNYLLLHTRATALNTPESEENIVLQQLDNAGKIVWAEAYSSGESTNALGIFQTKDFGYALLMLTNTGDGMKYFLIKTDERGKTR